MAGQHWSRLPSGWIRSRGLRRFTVGKRLGVSTAALKVLLAITLRAENNPSKSATRSHQGSASLIRDVEFSMSDEMLIALPIEDRAPTAGPNQGSASLSYDELMNLTDLSRPMVSEAIKLLQAEKIVLVKQEGRGGKNRYFLSDYGEGDRWGKIPNEKLYAQNNTDQIPTLHGFSCRREADLNALKLYLLFCAFRNTKTNHTMIGYEKIHEYTGIREARIRAAISVLIEHGLIRVDREKASEDKKNHPNRYEILGLSP
jgi:DNA-binding transcriptional ArsR family regulator